MNNRILRKFGFVGDQDGIINRYLREAENWKLHLDNTKNFILKSASNKLKSKVCILGSGWLLDVPYQELSEIFQEVVLIDIRQPRQITHKFQKLPNFKLFEADISGLIEPVYCTVKENKKNGTNIDLNNLKPSYSEVLINQIQQSDYVVSVNLLNQLDIIIVDYLNKTKQLDTEKIGIFRKEIQNNHIELLPKGRSALITDFEEINLNKDGQVVNRKKLVYDHFSENQAGERWTWEFDSNGTYRKNLSTIFKVMAVEL